jgi:hypothetical protein
MLVYQRVTIMPLFQTFQPATPGMGLAHFAALRKRCLRCGALHPRTAARWLRAIAESLK